MQRISVFCGSSMGSDKYYQEQAIIMANYLADNNKSLVYGGANIGIMKVLADTMLSRGKEVIGVMPRSLAKKEIAHEGLTKMHLVKSMSDRKSLIVEISDAFIAFPGGMGTLDELSEVLTLNQIRVVDKPMGILNLKGYFNHFLSFVENAVNEGFMRKEHLNNLIVSDSIDELLIKMKAYRPIPMSDWIKDIKTESANK